MRILPATTLWLMASTAFPVPWPAQELVWAAGLTRYKTCECLGLE